MEFLIPHFTLLIFHLPKADRSLREALRAHSVGILKARILSAWEAFLILRRTRVLKRTQTEVTRKWLCRFYSGFKGS